MDALTYRELRPRRNIVKPCLDYSEVLLREEEQALRKALYVSLRDKRLQTDGSLENGNDASVENDTREFDKLPDHEKSRESHKKQESITSTNKTKTKRIRKKRRKNENILIDDSNEMKKSIVKMNFKGYKDTYDKDSVRETKYEGNNDDAEIKHDAQPKSCSHFLDIKSSKQERRPSHQSPEMARRALQAQRKFAQSQPCSPNSLQIQRMGVPTPERPKTEDFIKFLCLRGTSNLPKELEYFNEPVCPASPLSSEEDEFLPLSPFFNSQHDSAIDADKSVQRNQDME